MRSARTWRALALALAVAVCALVPARGVAQSSQQSHSPHHWTTGNLVLAGAYVGAVWIDLAQTRYFLKDPRWEESNPILGKHPSPLKVDLLGLAGVAAMVGTAHYIRNPWRSIVLAIGAAVETRVIAYNSTGGVGIRLY